MLEKFEMGKRYVFSKELHKKSCERVGIDYDTVLEWKDEIDGKEVTVRTSENGFTNGFIGGYIVDPRWCIEKEDI